MCKGLNFYIEGEFILKGRFIKRPFLIGDSGSEAGMAFLSRGKARRCGLAPEAR